MEWAGEGNKEYFRIIVIVNLLANHQDKNNVIFIENPAKAKQHSSILSVINIEKIPWFDHGEIPWVISVPEAKATFFFFVDKIAQNYAWILLKKKKTNIQCDYISVKNDSESVSLRL